MPALPDGVLSQPSEINAFSAYFLFSLLIWHREWGENVQLYFLVMEISLPPHSYFKSRVIFQADHIYFPMVYRHQSNDISNVTSI